MPALHSSLIPEAPGSLIQAAVAPPRREPDLRAFGDTAKTRQRIYEDVLAAAQGIEPMTNDRHTLRLGNVRYIDPEHHRYKDQKDAILQGRTMARRLRGTWELLDNTTGGVLDKRDQVIAHVPHLTQRGTFIHNGSEYTLNHQQRLRSGVFTRIKANGEIEAHANIMPGKGRSHRYMLDPARGTFNVHVGQASLPLLPLLRTMGATDDQLREAWGAELLAANVLKDDATALKKFKQKFLRPRDLEDTAEDEQRRRLVEKFNTTELDPDITERTLGKRFDRLNLETILATTKKLLAVNRGEQEVDDRDHLAYQTFVGPEDLLAERIRRDHGRVRQHLFFKSTLAGNLKHMPSSALSPQLEQALLGSGLGQAIEEINPSEIFDKQTRITRLGEGGIASMEAIPEEARSVQPSHLGFMDAIRTPESFRAGVDTHLARGAQKGRDGRLYAQFRDLKTGEMVWKSPQDLADVAIAFPGALRSQTRRVPAMKSGKITYVPRDEIAFELPSFEDAFSPLGNLVPLKSAAKGQRMAMASRMYSQAVPLVKPEAPLVQSGMPGSNGSRSYEEEYGSQMGAVRADRGGRVVAVGTDEIKVRYDDGTDDMVDLYSNFPFNRKTFVHQYPTVKSGDRFQTGQLLARSNYTDHEGTTAVGVNARVAYLPWKGLNFEDAIIVSESMAAKKLASEHMYQHDLAVDERTRVGMNAYVSLFPGKFDKSVLQTIGKDGVVAVGTVVGFGHPLILAARERDRADNKIHKKRQPGFNDAAVLWDHQDPGVVTDVAQTKNGPVVVVKAVQPMRVGDKMCYDPGTEVLTDAGWKWIGDVTTVDRVATLVNGQLQYLNPVAIHEYDHAGRMYRLKTTQVDLLVTDNHKLYAEPRDGEYGLYEARELYGRRYRLKRNAEWLGASPDFIDLPGVAVAAGKHGHGSRQIPALRVRASTYAMLLGMFLSEGNIVDQPGGGSYGFDLSQTKPDSKEEMLLALQDAGIKFSSHCCGNKVRVYGIQWLLHFYQFGHAADKFIPPEVFHWDKDLLTVLYRWLMWGDGSTKGTMHVYTTTSRRLANDVQRLALHLGRSANIRETAERDGVIKGNTYRFARRYDVQLYRHKHRPTINHGHVNTQNGQEESWSEYKGKVHCVTMPKGNVIYVRRNGKPVWCGNSGRFGDKGVISAVISDHMMPHDSQGQPFEVLLNPNGIITRGNPAQTIEAMLGKVAAVTGKPYKVSDFEDIEDLTAFAQEELRKHGLSDQEDIVNPEFGNKIPGVATGNRFFMKLHHSAESKVQARGGGAYSAEDAPAKGGAAGCFTAATLVRTLLGDVSIGYLVDSRLHTSALSVDLATGKTCWQPITDWFAYKVPISDVIEICLENGSTMHVTKQHKMILADGTERLAGDLQSGDDLMEVKHD